VAAPCSQWIACSPVRNGSTVGRSTRSLERTMIMAPNAPARVRTGITLLWASVLITLVKTIVGDLLAQSAAIVAVTVVLAIYGLVVFRASRRHNWARYVILAWTALAIVTYVTAQSGDTPIWEHLLVALSFAIDIVAIFLLFTGEAAQWYRAQTAA
jgi:hypothetical protein